MMYLMMYLFTIYSSHNHFRKRHVGQKRKYPTVPGLHEWRSTVVSDGVWLVIHPKIFFSNCNISNAFQEAACWTKTKTSECFLAFTNGEVQFRPAKVFGQSFTRQTRSPTRSQKVCVYDILFYSVANQIRLAQTVILQWPYSMHVC